MKDVNKPKVMLHYIMPPNTSGPNTSMARIESSWLRNHYEFGRLVQDERPGYFNRRLLNKMIAQVRELKPDIVHISGLQSAGFYAVIAARLGGCNRVITTVRGSSNDAIGFNKAAKLLFRFIIEPLTMNMSSAVYTVCGEMAQKLGIAKRKNFVGIIHNPAPKVEYEEYSPAEFRAEIKAGQEDVVITCVGRMVHDKGIPFIIEAIKNGNNDNKKYVFVGDGPYCEELDSQLEREIDAGRVFVLGKRNDVFRILAGSDIFLFATLHENLSNALLEACSMGLAIIATRVGGNLEVIEDGCNGVLIPPHDSRAIIDAVDRLVNDREKRKRLGSQAREKVERDFSQETILSRVDALYRTILAKQ